MMPPAVETTVPCCITGSRDAVLVAIRDRHGNPLRTVMSRKSGLVFTDPRPDEHEIRQFYAEDYRKNYKQVETPKAKHILRAGRLAIERIERLATFLPAGASMLDAGSGGGEFVYLAGKSGFDAHGIEPNRGYAGFSQKHYGIDVFNGFYQDAEFSDGQFDAITMWHVLEHLEDPVSSIALLSRFLKPGGLFAIEVPNVESIRTAPNQKWHIGHLYNFSPQTLHAVAAMAGLREVRIETPDDGGVIFAVLEKPAEEAHKPDVSDILAGSFDRTWKILRRHTPVKHYLKFSTPLARVLRKAARGRDENKTLRALPGGEPVGILDSLRAA